MEIDYTDIVKNIKVFGIEDSIKASKYPMSIDTTKTNSDITNTVIKLAQAEKGSGHDQFLTGIVVQFDLKFTIKAWTEMERYNFINFVSSQSTVHRITKFDLDKAYVPYVDKKIIDIIKEKVKEYNENPSSEKYLELLYSNPCGMQLTAKLTTNYRQLKTIYTQRKYHKLPEWRLFCEFIEHLPYSKEFITGVDA